MNLSALAATEPAAVWVLSAGPNGIVETPFFSWLRGIVKAVAKDIDIGVRIDPDGIH